MKKRFFSALLALTLILSLAACSNKTSAPASTAPEKNIESPDSGAAKRISILTPYLSSVTTNEMVEAMKKGLEDNGMEVTVVDTKGDFGQLASRIEDVVSSKPDAMILVSADPNQVKTQLQAAIDAGIPVFGCDSGYIDGMMVNATSDNYAMDEQIVRYLFEGLMKGKGTVIALTHRPHPGVVKRCEAFDTVLKEYPDIKLITEQHVEVPGPIENSRKIMENLILSNPNKDSITAVWCAWDEPAIGATQALQDAGRDEVIVTGVDGNSQAVEMIYQGSNLKATLAQNFEGMAEIVVDDIVKLLSGQEIETGEKYAPATLITKD